MTVDSNFAGKLRTLDAKDPLFVVQFSAIAKTISDSTAFQSVQSHFNAQDVANIVCKLERYVEQTYGRNSPMPRAFTKLPFRMYRDRAVGGATHKIIVMLLDEMKAQSVRSVDELFALDRSILLSMLKKIEQDLTNVRPSGGFIIMTIFTITDEVNAFNRADFYGRSAYTCLRSRA